ncbi:MAG: tRNA pseudouridine(38-40) synthase TruA [Candidatus Omnitrophota bacterium]
MRNIKFTITYDGTNYKGWQRQKDSPTVQAEVEAAVAKVFGKHHHVWGASRTDAGVHARAQIAHIKIKTSIPVENIKKAINTILPEDIGVVDAQDMPLDFHAQFQAKSKLYCYHILNSRDRDPFTCRYAWRVPYKLNVSLMKEEAAFLVGEHDFKSFQASDKRERSSVREIFSINIEKKKTALVVEIQGSGFLYNMVRNVVGTLVEIGRGHFSSGSMCEVLYARDRTKAGPTAPAKGLFLMDVVY